MNKKSYSILLFLLLVTFSSQAQNYRPILEDNASLFASDANQNLYVMKVDSSTTESGKERFHFLKTIADESYCYEKDYSADWTGTSLLQDNDAFFFFNSAGESIQLQPSEEVGATWTLYQYTDGRYIEATVSSKDWLTFLSLSDSVKTISLQFKTAAGISADHAVNNLTVQLSKNYGILSIFAPRDFPFNYPVVHTLIGLSQPAAGMQLPTSRQFYEFSVGDEFHYEESKMNNYEAFNKVKRILKIKTKYTSANTDTVRYTISDYSHTEKQVFVYPTDGIGMPTWYYTHSSEELEYVKEYILDDSVIYPVKRFFLEAEEYQGMDYIKSCAYTRDEADHGRIIQINDAFPIVDNSPSCYYPVIDFPLDHLELMEGAGKYSYDRTSILPYREQLVYYKKGNETWGEALVLSSYTRINEAAVALFPNPLKQGERLFIQKGNFRIKQVTVYNTTGNKVLESSEPEQESIDVSGLQPGLYVVQLLNNNNEFVSSKLIIK